MDQFNFWLLPVVAFIPLIIGAIWYNPSVFGKAWMRSAEITEERAQSGSMIKIYGLAYLFGLLGAYILMFTTVHQTAMYQLFFMDPALEDPASAYSQLISNFMSEYGDRHRTFSHGLVHGSELAFVMGLVMIGIPSLFERRPWQYTLIHLGYWVLCFALMAGCLSAFL
jgi:hypothetical protein